MKEHHFSRLTLRRQRTVPHQNNTHRRHIRGAFFLTETELHTARGSPPPPPREVLLEKVREALSGLRRPPYIHARRNEPNHPAVQKGQRSHEEVHNEFIALWGKDHGNKVTWEEFLDYCKDISASIDSDDYFELLMHNAWHLSGGEPSSYDGRYTNIFICTNFLCVLTGPPAGLRKPRFWPPPIFGITTQRPGDLFFRPRSRHCA